MIRTLAYYKVKVWEHEKFTELFSTKLIFQIKKILRKKSSLKKIDFLLNKQVILFSRSINKDGCLLVHACDVIAKIALESMSEKSRVIG